VAAFTETTGKKFADQLYDALGDNYIVGYDKWTDRDQYAMVWDNRHWELDGKIVLSRDKYALYPLRNKHNGGIINFVIVHLPYKRKMKSFHPDVGLLWAILRV